MGLFFVAAAGFGVGALMALLRGLPQVTALEDFSPPSSTKIFAADGSLLAEFATQRRTPVNLEAMPDELVKAVLAIEDHRFFNHIGINVGRIVKALAVDLMEGRAAQGASTITQQLAKILFLTPDKTIKRKLKEALLALEIEKRYTKKEILSFYLNQIYLGEGAYGIAAASEVYFSKSVSDLTLAECALLASLPKAPSLFDPFTHPQNALNRRNTVIARMASLGWIDPNARDKAMAEPLPTGEPPEHKIRAPYFVEAVRRRLLEKLGLDLVYEGGLRVYTTLDSSLQKAAEFAVQDTLKQVDARHPKKKPTAQAAALALDPATGAVRALVGGRDWAESSFDRATQAKRQPGSGYKPIVYLAAIENGLTQSFALLDSPAEYPGARRNMPWKPGNYDRNFMGEMSLRKALALSRNLPAVRLMDHVGKSTVDEMASRLGLASSQGQGLASALGVGSVSLLEMTRAYSVAPSGGLLPEPYFIKAVYGGDGRNMWPRQPAPKRVIGKAEAYVLADMLRAVVESGTAKKARVLPFQTGGKTGTTDDQRDAWFVGFSSRLTVGAWVGRDDNTPLGWGETGAQAALPIWMDIMLASSSDGPPPPLPVPRGINFAEIDVNSGKLAGHDCEEATYAAFIVGTEPRIQCNREAFSWGGLVGPIGYFHGFPEISR